MDNSGYRGRATAVTGRQRILAKALAVAIIGSALALTLLATSFSASAASTPPTISNMLPSGVYNRSDASLYAYYYDADSGINKASVAVYLDGTSRSCSVGNNSVTCGVGGLAEGVHEFTVYVSDNAGNQAYKTNSFTVALFPYELRDNATGGDCTLFGTWDAASKTCTMTRNLNSVGGSGIYMKSPGITLDGNGYTLQGEGSYGILLDSTGRENITVKNLVVTGYSYGIYAYYGKNCRFTDNNISSWYYYGILLVQSSDNVIARNTVSTSTNKYQGIAITDSRNNIVEFNSVTGTKEALKVTASNSNIIRNNTFKDSTVRGMTMTDSSFNTVYRNNFINNSVQAYISGGSGNVLNVAAPDGGNYWSDWTTPDANGDGFVDNPRVVTGGVDNLPRTTQVSLDNTGPAVTSIAPGGTLGSRSATIDVAYEDPGSGVNPATVSISLDGNVVDGCAVTASNASCNVYGLDNGTHEITVQAQDNAGNLGSGAGSFTVMAPYEIRDDGVGGDCPLIGAWDAAAKQCTLNRDAATGSTVGIKIMNNNVTLDGNGHTITGSAYYGVQMLTTGTGITVRNLHVEGYQYGVYGQYANNNRILDNTLSNWTIYGIFVTSSDNNTIAGNTITAFSRDSYNGIFLHTNSDNNRIYNNNISGGMKGLAIQFNANNNVFAGNNVSDTFIAGAFVLNSYNNRIYYNNFFNTNNPSGASGGSGNLYSVDAPTGGNYWDTYDEVGEGCVDSNGDGFCDTPRVLNGAQDYLPRVSPAGACQKPDLSLSRHGIYWGSYADYEARLLSVDYSVGSSSLSLYGEVVGATASNGVGLATGMPLELGSMAGGGSADFTIKYIVPPGVAAFSTTVYAVAEDACGNGFAYPSAYPGT